MQFKDEEQLRSFSREYDGHIFRDKAGTRRIVVFGRDPYFQVLVRFRQRVRGSSRVRTLPEGTTGAEETRCAEWDH